MATATGDEFDTWLISKLKSLNTDESVFTSYIKGILEGDEPEDEKNESLEGIISGITEERITDHCLEIMQQWKKLNVKDDGDSKNCTNTEDVDDRLVKLLENQAKPTIAARSYTDEEKKIREAILAQYSHMSDGEDEENNENVPNGSTSSSSTSATTVATSNAAKPSTLSTKKEKVDLTRNTNAEDVAKAERERREKSRLEAQQKKQKDKEDREKQKQTQQDKKEKRKTQKGERRR